MIDLMDKWELIIGPKSDHSLCLSLTDLLTNSLLLSKLDWCDPGVWRCLLEVVTVADVNDVDRVGNSLLQIWKLRFGHKAKFYSDLQFGWEFELKSGKISKPEFG